MIIIFFLILCINYSNAIENINDNSSDPDNATWVLSSAFVIITMQSGFGLLESGLVADKNQINIMMKNIADVVFGGLSFWLFGYGFSFGESEYSNSFNGFGDFFFDSNISRNGGWKFSQYFFQLSFATTATTIVSGSLAERCKFNAYCLFSILNTLIYCFPAHWVFSNEGWLYKLGCIDFAGGGPVHILGGFTGLVGCIMLGPRNNRNILESSPVNALLGLFMLWWGWLGFNCGSAFGITGNKWIYIAKAASTTLNASIAGGLASFLYSYLFNNKKYSVHIIVNGIISSLVSITPNCIYVSNWASLIIGFIGALISILFDKFIKRFIDDPIGCVSTHGIAGIWGLFSSAFFTNTIYINNKKGLLYSGNFYLLGVQLLEIFSIIIWSISISYIFFKLIDITIGLRLSREDEEIGNDLIEHIVYFNNDNIQIHPVNDNYNNNQDINNDNDNNIINNENNVINNDNNIINNNDNIIDNQDNIIDNHDNIIDNDNNTINNENN